MKMSADIDQGSGVVHLWTVRPDPASPEAFHDLQVVFEDFCIAIERGAFAAGANPGCRYSVQVQQGALVARLELSGTDVRYARVLRNILYAFEQVDQIDLDVRVAQTPPARTPLPLEVDETEVEADSFYPSRIPQLPFVLDLLDSERPDQNRRALFEYAAALDVAAEYRLRELTGYWARIAEFGYAPSEQELQDGSYGVFEVIGSLFDAVSFDVTVATFGAPEAAWHSLLNMMAFVGGARCVRVEVE